MDLFCPDGMCGAIDCTRCFGSQAELFECPECGLDCIDCTCPLEEVDEDEDFPDEDEEEDFD
jgi:hypothetical protein